MRLDSIDRALRLAGRGLLGLALAATAFSVDAAAQCPRPDGLDGGPCCTVAQPRYPKVPAFTQDSLGICWRNCDVETLQNYTAVWSPHLFTPVGGPCEVTLKRLALLDAAGTLAWSGVMIQQYSRTWLETDTAGDRFQVWRYLVNGDLRPTAAAGTVPCPVPPCAAANGNRVHYSGYVDYVRGCTAAGGQQYAWMLTHACDSISHAPGFPRGGAFHPDHTYSFVGPSLGFAPGALQPIEAGGSALEAVRRIRFGTGLGRECEFEEQINYGISPLQQLCVCGIAGAPPQWALGSLTLAGSCGTSITTPGGPFLPGFLSMGIGVWTIPGSYPGVERLRWNAGGYDYLDPCSGTTKPEVFFGVTTIGGFAANQVLSSGVGPTLPLTFIDQANSLKGLTTIMNVGFKSNHILNLNL